MCRDCGNEVCAKCYQDLVSYADNNSVWHPVILLINFLKHISIKLQHMHSVDRFLPISRFKPGVLQDTIIQMQSCGTQALPLISALPSVLMPSVQAAVAERSVFRINPHELTGEIFQHIWSLGIPIVVPGAEAHLQGRWTPADLVKRYGNDLCHIYDCEDLNAMPTPSTVGAFFERFCETDDTNPPSLKLKV
jgi:hypothetical protein